MIVELHLCGPVGDVRRQQLTRLLNELKRDNAYVINAMLNAGQHVADTVIELGLDYDPAGGTPEAETQRQRFFGMREMVESGTFRCGEASAYEAAVMETKYGIPTMVLCVPQGATEYHGIYVTEDGAVDPTENWLRYWEAMEKQRSVKFPNPAKGRAQVEQLPMCRIDNGKVECTGLEDHTGCCVGSDGRWRCPDNHPLHGKDADVRRYRSRQGQRWALVGTDRVPVPVCPSPRRAAR